MPAGGEGFNAGPQKGTEGFWVRSGASRGAPNHKDHKGHEEEHKEGHVFFVVFVSFVVSFFFSLESRA